MYEVDLIRSYEGDEIHYRDEKQQSNEYSLHLRTFTSKVGFLIECVKIAKIEMIFKGMIINSLLIENKAKGKVHLPNSSLSLYERCEKAARQIFNIAMIRIITELLNKVYE
jgi:hypothetical protein